MQKQSLQHASFKMRVDQEAKPKKSDKDDELSRENGAVEVEEDAASPNCISDQFILQTIQPMPSPPQSTPGAFARGPEFARPPRDFWEPVRAQTTSAGTAASTVLVATGTGDESRSDSQLVEAREVSEDEENPHGLAEARPVDLDDKQISCKRCKLFLGFGAILLLAWVVLSLVFLEPWNDTSDGTEDVDSHTGIITPEEYLWKILDDSGFPSTTNTTLTEAKMTQSAEMLALHWLANDPNMRNYSSSRLLQRYALSSFYYATQGEHWNKSTGWNSYQYHECDWFAQDSFVTFSGLAKTADSPCDENGTYTRLWLSDNHLKGTIPEEIYHGLPSLTSMNVNVNPKLGGTISPHIENLQSLRDLSLISTNMSGTLPTELGLLPSLEYLYLAKTFWGRNFGAVGFSGSLPSELGQLTKLQQFVLWDNSITSTLPTELGLMKDLKLLMANKNDISGTIPTELGNLK